MFGIFKGIVGRAERDADKARDDVPPELTAAIEAAHVFIRNHGADENIGSAVVRVATLGTWTWDGAEHAKRRILRHWDVTPRAASRAARLLAGQVGAANRRRFREPDPVPWVWRW